MGTSIHLYVERRHPNGTWVMLHPPECPPEKRGDKFPWWGPGLRATPCDGCVGARCRVCGGTGRDPMWYQARNYEVFEVLRNIAPPRGFPDDMSKAVEWAYSGDRTESWLLVLELLACDWKELQFGEFVRDYLVPLGSPSDIRIVFGFDS